MKKIYYSYNVHTDTSSGRFYYWGLQDIGKVYHDYLDFYSFPTYWTLGVF